MPPTSAVTDRSAVRFAVRALDQGQHLLDLELEAVNEAEAWQQALARQLSPLSIRQVRAGSGLGWPGRGRQSMNLVLFVQELHALSAAGLSITETLETLLERSTSPQVQHVMQQLLERLREGLRLSQAMQLQAEVFPPLLVGIVQSAEDTSDLPQALNRYVQYETQLQGLKHKVISAAIYPLILLGVGGGVALFLLGYVVPRFSTVYQGTGRPLPRASQWLLDWGLWMTQHQLAVFLVLGAGLAWAAWRVMGWQRSGNWWLVLRAFPGARPRLEILELSRLYLTLSMLLEGGIPIRRAMQLAAAVIPPARQSAWNNVRQQVTEGRHLTESMEQHGFSTPVASRLLRVGERSGQIGVMLGKTAAFYESETSRWIDRFSKSFEPILMAIIGIVIGLIVILLYMPVFDLAGSLQ